MARASFIIGLVAALVVGIVPYFPLRMAMFFPAILGALLGVGGIYFNRRKRRPLLEAQFGVAMNLLALGLILVLAVLFSTFFAQRFVDEPRPGEPAEVVADQ